MTDNQPCPSCGGTGQIGFFQGVSRFLLSWAECPECAGLGSRLEPEGKEPEADRSTTKPGDRRQKSGVRNQKKSFRIIRSDF